MEEVKKDVIKNMGMKFPDNISIAISMDQEDNCIAGKSQIIHSTEEMDIEIFFNSSRIR